MQEMLLLDKGQVTQQKTMINAKHKGMFAAGQRSSLLSPEQGQQHLTLRYLPALLVCATWRPKRMQQDRAQTLHIIENSYIMRFY